MWHLWFTQSIIFFKIHITYNVNKMYRLNASPKYIHKNVRLSSFFRDSYIPVPSSSIFVAHQHIRPHNESNLAHHCFPSLSFPQIKMADSPAGFITLGHVTLYHHERTHLVRDKWCNLEVWFFFKWKWCRSRLGSHWAGGESLAVNHFVLKTY